VTRRGDLLDRLRLHPRPHRQDRCPLDDTDRFHLAIDVIDRVPGLGQRASTATTPPSLRDWV
jgi:hypothetical protein